MEQIVLIVHLLIALAIIGLILLQQGKGADMGASFGAGGSQTLFGSDGSGNALTRATSWLCAAFFATSFGLAMIATQQSDATRSLDVDIPVGAMDAAAQEPVSTEEFVGDLPVINDDIPAATATGAVPADDVPSIDDVPAVDDVPAPEDTDTAPRQ